MITSFRITVLVSSLTLLLIRVSFAQVGINTDNSQPNASAMLDVKWCTLTLFIDPTVNCSNSSSYTGTDVGIKMNSTTGWYGSGNGTNASGFTALPAGSRTTSGGFKQISDYTDHWTSTQHDTESNYAWERWLYYNSDGIRKDYYKKANGYSIRCLKN